MTHVLTYGFSCFKIEQGCWGAEPPVKPLRISVKFRNNSNRYVLTLESRCIPVVLGDVLFSRTLPDHNVINKSSQSSSEFHGTLVTDTSEYEMMYNYNRS